MTRVSFRVAASKVPGMSLSMVALCVLPLVLIAAPPSPLEPATVGEVLELGFARGPESLENLRNAWSRVANPRDLSPPLAHAWGIAFLKRVQYADCLAVLEQSRGPEEAPYWPGRKALIWLQLSRGHTGAAIRDMVAAAEWLERQPEPVEASHQELLVWLGSCLGAMEVLSRPTDLALWNETDQRVRAVLTGDRLSAYRLGVDQSLDLAEELGEQLDSRRKQSREAALARLDQVREEVGKDQLQILDKKQAAANAEQSLEEKFSVPLAKLDQQLQDYEITLAAINRDRVLLEGNLINQLANIRNLQHELSHVDPSSPTAAILEQTLWTMQQQAGFTQRRLGQVLVDYNSVAQQGRRVALDRERMQLAYQKETGKVANENAQLDRWSKRVAQFEKQAEQQVEQDPVALRSFKARTRSLVTYVPFSAELERQRLLAAAVAP